MGKKKTRSKYTSKGNTPSVSRKTLNGMRKERNSNSLINKIDAWAKGKNTWFTIENPNKNETNRKFIRIRGSEYMGDWRSNVRVILK